MKNFINRSFKILLLSVMLIFTSFFVIQSDRTTSEFLSYQNTLENSFPLAPPWEKVPSNDYTNEQYNLDVINAYEAWLIESGSVDVTVAIIDSGIDTDHQEFVGRISELSYNAYTEQVGISYVEDDLGHGTNVAGVIAAKRDNSLGIDGITDNVRLMIIKANNYNEEFFSNSAVARGVIYAVDNGADIINMSLGSTTISTEVKNAIEYAHQQGVFVVAASGNNGLNEDFYPAAYETTISVGSINQTLSLSDFSNYGETLSLVAPGSDIYTTDLNNGYAIVNGTSFSAPHISGVLALLLSYETISYEEALNKLLLTTLDLGDLGEDIYFGFGLVDANRILSEQIIEISFETFGGTEILNKFILANQSYLLTEEPLIDDLNFNGWYLDDQFVNALDEFYVFTNDTILYAKYEIIYYEVQFMIEDTLYSTISVRSGDIISDLPNIEIEEKTFGGWYFSNNYDVIYDKQTVTENLVLYAKITDIYYLVQFLDYELNVFYETEVVANTEVSPPTLDNYNTEFFNYNFVEWNQDLNSITEDIIVSPIYEKIFITESITLNPGIDTIYQYSEWVDGGLDISSEELTYTVSHEINTSITGEYLVTYHVKHQSEIVHELIRYVNVINNEKDIKITINPGINTIILSQNYSEAGAISEYGEIEVIGSVDTTKVGKYQITYRLIFEDKTIEKHRFVYVINPDVSYFAGINWYLEKSDENE